MYKALCNWAEQADTVIVPDVVLWTNQHACVLNFSVNDPNEAVNHDPTLAEEVHIGHIGKFGSYRDEDGWSPAKPGRENAFSFISENCCASSGAMGGLI